MAYVEVLIGAVVAFGLGFLWYTVLFGKVWKAESGVTDEQAQSDMARTHGLAFLMIAILCYGVNTYINYHEVAEQTFTHGGFHGGMLALIYALPAVAINYLYQKKSLKLFLIDGAYILAFMALAGAVMAALKLG